MLGSTSGLVVFLLMLWTRNFYLVVMAIFIIGMFIVPLVPAMLEFACETCFPIGEATATGFIYAISHIFGGVGGICFTELVKVEDNQTSEQADWSRIKSSIALGIILFFFACGIILTIRTKENLKRLNLEK